MTEEIAKRWSNEIEEQITQKWVEEEPFKFNVDDVIKNNKKVYSIDTPPPYVDAPIHIGQAVTYSMMDMFARYKRMKGFAVLFPLGLDRNGLPIEMAAQKKFNITPEQVGREKFLEYCRQILEESSNESIKTFMRLGISFNSYKFGENIGQAYMTDSNDYRLLTQKTFYEMWKKGLIYEGNYISNYCPGCKTTLADSEVVYEERTKKLWYVKFKVKETDETIIIATTRPELLGSCKAVIFNPDDDRYKHLQDKTAITPLGDEVKIFASNYASMEFGTGLVMMCSFGDLTDIRFFREHKLEPVILIDENGLMNEKAGMLKGLTVEEARKKIVEWLKQNDAITKEETITARVPVCERSKHQIEFIQVPELYLKQEAFKQELMEIAKQINFYDEASRQMLLNWIESINQDWPISRKRYYATAIPLWYCEKCGNPIIGDEQKYYEPWKDKPPVQQCPKCKHTKFKPETRVFDTWFDSSISCLYILGYKKHDDFFKIAFPCTLRPQGKDIVRTWLYYTLLRVYLLLGKAAFKDVWINFHIVDAKGKKMSKSMGNVIDPKQLIEKYGSEALRLWCVVEANITKQDMKCKEEKIKAETKTITKLLNIARYIAQFDYVDESHISNQTDKSFLEKLNELIDLCDKCYDTYDFHNPAIKLKHFLWEVFASHYIELTKARAYSNDKSAVATLYAAMKRLLLLLYPIIPIAASYIYERLFKADILHENFPAKINIKAEVDFSKIQEINSIIWKYKKEKGLSLKAELASAVLPELHKDVIEDLKRAHNIKQVFSGDNIKIE